MYKRFKAHSSTKRTVNDLLKFLSLIAKPIIVQLTTKHQEALHKKMFSLQSSFDFGCTDTHIYYRVHIVTVPRLAAVTRKC